MSCWKYCESFTTKQLAFASLQSLSFSLALIEAVINCLIWDKFDLFLREKDLTWDFVSSPLYSSWFAKLWHLYAWHPLRVMTLMKLTSTQFLFQVFRWNFYYWVSFPDHSNSPHFILTDQQFYNQIIERGMTNYTFVSLW